MSYYVPLPAYKVPAGINFEPINQALEGVLQQNNANRLYALQQQQSARADAQLDIDRQRAGDAHQAAVSDREYRLAVQSAGIAQAALTQRDPAKKAAMMTQLYGLHPEYKNCLVEAGIDPNDYDSTANFIVSTARGYQDPRDSQIKDLEVQKGRAEIRALDQKNSVNSAISGLISGASAVDDPNASPTQYNGTSPSLRQPIVPPNSSGSFQPQSFEGGPMPRNALMPVLNPGGQPPMSNALYDSVPVNPVLNAFVQSPARFPGSPPGRDEAPPVPHGGGNGIPDFAGGYRSQGQTPGSYAQQPAPQQPQAPSGLILTGNNDPVPQSAPPAGPVRQAQPNLVRTPLGPMTKDRAQRLGFGLAMADKGDAGKIFIDAANQNALDKGSATENDKNELAATSQMAVLDDIKNSFDTSYLNIPNRFKLWGTSLMDKFGSLSEDDQKDLAGYTRFRQTAWQNLNTVLKQLSGTAVTENEMKRQLETQPNAGTGIADGDSPTEFATKVRGQMAFAQSAIARARWLRNQGFTGAPWEAGVPIEAMPSLIKKRGDELYQQYQQANPKADPQTLKGAVQRNLKQEFGI